MAEGISDNSEKTDSVEVERDAKEMASELTALEEEFRKLLDPEVITIIIKLHSNVLWGAGPIRCSDCLIRILSGPCTIVYPRSYPEYYLYLPTISYIQVS